MTALPAIRTAFAAAALLALGACGPFNDELGLTKQPPDEFRVLSRAPLSIPPNYPLAPPAPGTPRPQEGTPTDQARTAVFGTNQGGNALTSGGDSGEQAFLNAAGADEADPQIRQVVDAETRSLNAESSSFIDALIFWQDESQPGVVVDPAKEAQRIKENQALGRPVTEGETPTIERREKGVFEGIF